MDRPKRLQCGKYQTTRCLWVEPSYKQDIVSKFDTCSGKDRPCKSRFDTDHRSRIGVWRLTRRSARCCSRRPVAGTSAATASWSAFYQQGRTPLHCRTSSPCDLAWPETLTCNSLIISKAGASACVFCIDRINLGQNSLLDLIRCPRDVHRVLG
jgi:hypothetical protein